MILHSIARIDAVFPTPPQESCLLPCRHGWLDCVEEKGQQRIRRLISTDPKAYLDNRYTPGNFYQEKHK